MGLNKRQIEALTKASANANDIVNNPEFLKELNEEIMGTYDQKLATQLAAAEGLPVRVAAPAPVAMGAAQPVSTIRQRPGRPAPKIIPAKEEPLPVKKEEKMATEFNIVQDDDAEFDKELAKIEAVKAKEEAKKAAEASKDKKAAPVQEAPKETIKDRVLLALSKRPNAPTLEQLEKLKQDLGSLQVIALSDDDVFIFTHLRRSQFKKIQEIVGKAAQTEAFSSTVEDQLKEKVVSRCVVWPKGVGTPEFIYNSRAGLMDTLYELIMIHSYFLTPSQALSITVSI
jgi:hypothetical protein